jgi:phosphoenolpyruvate carboxylase
MKPRIPATMGTQHPDSASRRVPIQEEPEEAVQMLDPDGLGIEEIMIDFEGKLTPWHQPWRTAVALKRMGVSPGEDVFITPRLPSAEQESVGRQLMGILAVLDAIGNGKELQDTPLIHEVVIPMAESGMALWKVRERVAALLELLHSEGPTGLVAEDLYVIPLVESVPQLVVLDQIIEEYVQCNRDAGFDLDTLRVMIARSDPALRYGMVAATLSNKVGLSACYRASERLGIDVAPIWGAGSLPFRGHLTPDNMDNIVRDFRGLHTITIQSALRYDHPPDRLKELVGKARRELPTDDHLAYSDEEVKEILMIIGVFARSYVRTLERLAGSIAAISDLAPRQRDRLTRDSLAGYGRSMHDPSELNRILGEEVSEVAAAPPSARVNLPRVITFCAATYSMGLPPEFIGTGRALRAIEDAMGEAVLDRLLNVYYPSLKDDLAQAHKFMHLDTAKPLLDSASQREVETDVQVCHDLFDLNSIPGCAPSEYYVSLLETAEPLLRRAANGKGLEERQAHLAQELIQAMGVSRGSLG